MSRSPSKTILKRRPFKWIRSKDQAPSGRTPKPAPFASDAKKSQRYLMPVVMGLMFAISAVFYLRTAQDDVDRYPWCFVENCGHLN